MARFPELLQPARHPVVGERLDLGARARAADVELRPLARGERVERAEVPARAQLPGELGRAEDVRGERHVAVVGVGHLALRRAADAPAVEEQRLGPVEAPVVVRALVAEAEDARVLDEERALLLEERLDVREVHHRRVHLDLAEVGVRGGVERQLAPHAHAQVGAPARGVARAVVERVEDFVLEVLGLAGHVGQHLDRARGAQAVQTHQVGEARDEPALLLGRVDQEVRLVAPAREVAPEVDAPHLVGLAVVAELRERDPHLDGPAQRVAAGPALPHAVPGRVVPAVVEERAVVQHARRVHREVVAAPPVVERVEEHGEAVR